jgi:hypothetical protein
MLTHPELGTGPPQPGPPGAFKIGGKKIEDPSNKKFKIGGKKYVALHHDPTNYAFG